MGNKAFLMSLVPLLDNIPENQLIPLRCQLMETVQKFLATPPTPSYAAQNTSNVNQYFQRAPDQPTYNYSHPQTSQQYLYATQRPTQVIPTPTPSPGQYLDSLSPNSEATK